MAYDLLVELPTAADVRAKLSRQGLEIKPDSGVISGLVSVRVRTLEVSAPPQHDDGARAIDKSSRRVGTRTGVTVANRTLQEAHRLLARAQRNRKTQSTDSNRTSSRSHAIYTIKLVKVPVDGDDIYEVRGRHRYTRTQWLGSWSLWSGHVLGEV